MASVMAMISMAWPVLVSAEPTKTLTSSGKADAYRRHAGFGSLASEAGTVFFMIRNQRDRDAIEQLDRLSKAFNRRKKQSEDKADLPPSYPFRLATIEVELEPLRDAGHRAGATVNDLLLLAVADALRAAAARRGVSGSSTTSPASDSFTKRSPRCSSTGSARASPSAVINDTINLP